MHQNGHTPWEGSHQSWTRQKVKGRHLARPIGVYDLESLLTEHYAANY